MKFIKLDDDNIINIEQVVNVKKGSFSKGPYDFDNNKQIGPFIYFITVLFINGSKVEIVDEDADYMNGLFDELVDWMIDQ